MSGARRTRRWLREHRRDPYVRDARVAGWRSRAAFKLLDLDRRDRLLRPGAVVVDLGAAPGGWSQVAAAAVGPKGIVFAIDILPIEPIAGVRIIRGDLEEARTRARLAEGLGARTADVVLCDMAPDLSGVADRDAARAERLHDLALETAGRCLRPGGDLVLKAFHGRGSEHARARLGAAFERVAVRKPAASRGGSAEIYLVARGWRGPAGGGGAGPLG